MICVTCQIVTAAVLTGTAGGGTLSQADLDRGTVPKPGDQVILRDFARLAPQEAIGKTSVPGKWWLRPYKTDRGETGTMLMTVQRNMARPESCIVPAVTYPLSLKGWYEIWVATYRGPYGGGIDVRLTGDDCFVHLDPQQVDFHPKRPKPRVGAIVEINYKPAADLTGQGLVFQQPFGTYESFHWGFCEASLAYIRLVRLSDEQVAAFKKDQASDDRRLIAFDDDYFSRFWMWDGQDRQTVLRVMEAFRYHDIAFFGMNIGAMASVVVPTPYSDLRVSNMRRLGDRRVNASYKSFIDKGIDPVAISAERAHAYGFKLLPTLRMSSAYDRGPKYKALSKWLLKDRVHFNFACDEIHDYYVKLVRYILEKYDVDGFVLDYTRHRIHFNKDQPDKARYMNEFSRKMREMVDQVSKAKGKKLLLAASFTEASYARAQPLLEYQGIDVAAWVKGGYYDIIMPEGRNIDTYIKLTRGTSTKCFPRWTATRDIRGEALGPNVHDPTPQEDTKDRPINPHLGPKDYEAGWLKLRESGADGLYVFNNAHGWTSLRRMGHLDEVRRRVQAGEVYGVVEGPIVRFED
jgi:hypothetical protein